MKFLFIVQTEGRGHMSQAMVLADWLEEANHVIARVCVAKGHKTIPSYFLDRFGSNLNFFESPQFSYDAQASGMNLPLTFGKNICRTFTFCRSIKQLRTQIRDVQPDVVINFYELLGSLAHFFFPKKHKYIVLSHHFYLTTPYHNLIKGRPLETLLLKFLNTLTAQSADQVWALSFRANKDLGKLKILPPLVRSTILEAVPSSQDYILAYAVNKGYGEQIKAWQAKYPETVVHYFGEALENSEEEIQPNLFFHKIDQELFTQYLTHCNVYLSTAGFESVCEALYLGKKLLLVPVSRHIEQSNNAIDAVKAGAYGFFESFAQIPDPVSLSSPCCKDLNFKTWVASGRSVFLKQLES